MPANLVRLYAFTLSFCESLMADVTDEELRHQPAPGVNTPAWILGHLAICTDFALTLLGQPKRLPDDWHVAFARGSDPASTEGPAPSRDQLLTALREGHAAVSEVLPAADEAALAEPNPLVILAKAFPTKADLLAHLLTTHEAMHLGQLSSWRRQMGRPPLF
ncbi:MAG: DinB family protein [Planctomycetota bacterium]